MSLMESSNAGAGPGQSERSMVEIDALILDSLRTLDASLGLHREPAHP
jgi:hypothetical protein